MVDFVAAATVDMMVAESERAEAVWKADPMVEKLVAVMADWMV